MKKRALITGITGQDGSYLTEFLLEKGYEVHGIIRRCSLPNTKRIEHLFECQDVYNKTLFLHYGDMTDISNLNRVLEEIKPDEVYNLAGQSHVQVSFEIPEYTFWVNGTATICLLDSIRNKCSKTKFYQASTSELFGGIPITEPQDEKTPFYPMSPYAVSKLSAYWSTVNYREAYGLFAVNGILFNHESPRRGENFVTRKITIAVAKIKMGIMDKLILGNLDAKRDWGYAKDYVRGMWLMMQQRLPRDYILATGEVHTVRDFVSLAFKIGADVNIEWIGSGKEEIGINSFNKKVLIEVDEKFFRNKEVKVLKGNPKKAERELKWKRESNFEELVQMMVRADIDSISQKCKNANKKQGF